VIDHQTNVFNVAHLFVESDRVIKSNKLLRPLMLYLGVLINLNADVVYYYYLLINCEPMKRFSYNAINTKYVLKKPNLYSNIIILSILSITYNILCFYIIE